MNHYQSTFSRLKKENKIGFCPFAVLGDPDEKTTLERIKIYLEEGADFLELGIPFSDPVADGPVIQAATERSLRNGMTPKKAMALVKKIRIMKCHPELVEGRHWKQGVMVPLDRLGAGSAHHDIPIGILTYANIILQYGIQKFYRDLKAAGADSVLIADLPLEEAAPFARAAKKNHLHQIFLVSEYTDRRRLAKIEKLGSGFLYITSVLGVTGSRQNLPENLPKLIRFVKKHSRLPAMVGFGISKPAHIKLLQKYGADAAIIGSSLVKIHKMSALRKRSRVLESSRHIRSSALRTSAATSAGALPFTSTS